MWNAYVKYAHAENEEEKANLEYMKAQGMGVKNMPKCLLREPLTPE